MGARHWKPLKAAQNSSKQLDLFVYIDDAVVQFVGPQWS